MKEFNCPDCGSRSFTMVHRRYTDVNFSQEGAIEGHPELHSAGEVFDSFFCNDCACSIPGEQAQEMLEEVI